MQKLLPLNATGWHDAPGAGNLDGMPPVQIAPVSLADAPPLPGRAAAFPQLRYMGSKHRLLPWIHSVLGGLAFESALDAFSGSGAVAYLLKAMGKQVTAADFLNFPCQITRAAVANSSDTLSDDDVARLSEENAGRRTFIEDTFSGVFFTPPDLRFLDSLWANLEAVRSPERRALAITAAVRACVKRQPRGVFTVTGDASRHDDGRRDLRLSLAEHFRESAQAYNAAVFDNGRLNRAVRTDVFEAPTDVDLVYFDPPYVPRADDNCYIKRYHFLEGLASYWSDEGTEILFETKARKIAKRYTPFSYRRTAVDAFDRMFRRFAGSTLVLSYSSSGFPDLDVLVSVMHRYKRSVTVHERPHRYHFGTHENVAPDRAAVREYLIIGE
jgi:DNA adenine methylase/adenine-specific DNA-methyltransferase